MSSILSSISTHLGATSIVLQLIKNENFMDILANLEVDGMGKYLQTLMNNGLIKYIDHTFTGFFENKEHQKVYRSKRLSKEKTAVLYLSNFLIHVANKSYGSLNMIFANAPFWKELKFDSTMISMCVTVATNAINILKKEKRNLNKILSGRDLVMSIMNSMTFQYSELLSNIINSIIDPSPGVYTGSDMIREFVEFSMEGINKLYNQETDLLHINNDSESSDSESSDSESSDDESGNDEPEPKCPKGKRKRDENTNGESNKKPRK